LKLIQSYIFTSEGLCKAAQRCLTFFRGDNMTRLFKILISEKGSAFIEYALWIALFVLVVAVAVSQLANATTGVIQDMITKISSD